MEFRDYVEDLLIKNRISQVKKEVDTNIEISAVLKTAEPRPIIFESIKNYPQYRIAGNLFSTKKSIADYLNISPSSLIPTLTKAIDNPTEPKEIENAPCQENIIRNVDLNDVPILRFNKNDGGRYISSAVVISKDPEYGQNLDFHRAMQLDKSRMSTRIIKGRDFYKFLERNGEVEVAFCIGNTPNILVAAATSVRTGLDELEIANTLSEFTVTRTKYCDLLIPSSCELVLEGKVYLEEKEREGPFIDLTETYDDVREEPVFEVKLVSYRNNPIYQALVPGGLEHKVLMGMPREPTIYKAVNDVGVKCLDVHINPGGCSWLHAIVKIDKQHEDDGKKAILAAFTGHKSCKHVFVVDDDIDIYNPLDVEWAMATRFQKEKGLVDYGKEPGSSLDPSAEQGTKLTNKVGFDLTISLKDDKKRYKRVEFPKVDLKDYGVL